MLRRALMTLAITTALAAVPASAQAAGFTDSQLWTAGDHALGRGRFDPANVTIDGGELSLGLPAARLDGAEVRTNALWGTGTFRARLKAANAPSSLTGFFLYAPPDYASEVDIEILDDPSGTVMFSTYAGGAQTHTETRALGFDPTAAYHDYEISLDRKDVTFLVDGIALRTWRTGVPRARMALYLNAWFPTWLAGTPAPLGAATLVDSVTIAAQ